MVATADRKLTTLLVNSQVMRATCVVVPDELAWGAGMPADAHPRNWIPRLDDRPPACGEPRRLDNVLSTLWCLRPENHRGGHW